MQWHTRTILCTVSATLMLIGVATLVAPTGTGRAVAQVPDADAIRGLLEQQIQNQVQNRPQPVEVPSETDLALIIEPTAPILNLLERAEEGIARRDWKFAIDSLQRVIDDPEASLVLRPAGSSDYPQLYESARRYALRRLASLPSEGLGSYRLLYDGKGRGLLEAGRRGDGESALREVVERFLLTRFGDDAADLLASRLLDQGRYSEAIAVLTDVLELVPDRDVGDRLLHSKLAAAHAMLGRRTEVHRLLDVMEAETIDEPENPLHASLLGILARRTPDADPVADLPSWPVAGGDPTRQNRMPEVRPTVVDSSPWRFDLPGSSSFAWRRVLDGDPTGVPTLPVLQPVADGNKLFTRRPGGLIALDLEDLFTYWEHPITSLNPASLSAQRQAFARWSSEVVFQDDVLGAVSVGAGLVFVLERTGFGSFPGQSTSVQQIQTGQQPTGIRAGGLGDASLRLVAYDAATGEMRWDRGRSFDPEDPLGEVSFRSVPLEINGRLWVPYIERNDLFVGVLEPTRGEVLHRVLLGSRLVGPLRQEPSLHPAAAEGLVFVPTGMGVLFALDADDGTVRWASRYGSGPVPIVTRPVRGSSRVITRMPDPSAWLPQPPMVSGGLVLLPAYDDERLLAFSTHDGEQQWAASIDGGHYLLAADQERIWVGGRSVTCLSLADGSLNWTRMIDGIPTGRAVRCGDLLHVPTADGLLTLDAESGGVLSHMPVSDDSASLGNLLCLRSSLYSVDAGTVRKFPDVDRTYATAAADYELRPGDSAAGLRLAWTELLRGHPERALAVIESIPAENRSEVPPRDHAIAHVHVEALRELSRDEALPVDEAVALLEEAWRVARTPIDRLRSGLEAADRLMVADRKSQAFEKLFALGMSPDAEQTVSLTDRVEARAVFDIARRLRELNRDLPLDERMGLVPLARSHFDEAKRNLLAEEDTHAARARLRALADLSVPKLSAEALLLLGEWAFAHDQFERAEQLFRECLRTSGDPLVAARARFRLCHTYGEEMYGAPALFHECLNEFEQQFGQSDFMDEPPPALPHKAGERVAQGTVGDWLARQQRDALAEPRVNPLSRDGAAGLPADPDPVWNIMTASFREGQVITPFEREGALQVALESALNTGPPRILHFDKDTARLLDGRAIFIAPGDVVYCQNVVAGDLAWHTALQMPETFVDLVNPRRVRGTQGIRTAAADGMIGVINATEGLFGIGLTTGRRLWVRPFEVPSEPGRESLRDPLMAAGEGVLAAMPRLGWLSLMRLSDGTTLWEHDLRGETVAYMAVTPRSVVTVDAALQRVNLYRLEDGRHLGRVHFRQLDEKGELVHLIHHKGVLCGPDRDGQTSGLLAVDTATGQTLWRVSLDKPIGQLFEPKEGYLGVGLVGGDVRLFNIRTGELLIDHRLPPMSLAFSGVLVDGTLVTMNVTVDRGRRIVELVALDVATGEIVWRRDDMAMLDGMDRFLRVHGGAIPMIVEYADPRFQRRTRLGLAMIDARTGANRGGIADIVTGQGGTSLNGDFLITTGGAVIGSLHEVKAFALEPVKDRPRSGL